MTSSTAEQLFDSNGNVTRTITNTYNAAGELTQISDPDSTYRYTYDLDGRVLSISNQGTPNVPTTIMSYTYDNVGNTLSVTDRINGTVDNTTSHQFDALNRMTVNSQGNKRVDYTYNAISQVTNKKRYSDSTGTNLVAETNHTYDTLNRLTNITHSKGANTIASYTQSYDADSKITGITSSADGSSTYTYDKTDQLVGADYNYQTDENYTYDANGNRTNTGYVTGINNRLLEDTKYRYVYDKVGNRTKRTDKSTNEVTEYSWDIRDRLTGIRVINALGEVIRTANYVYDVYDQRIAKIVDLDGDGLGAATTERFVYGSNQNIALVFDGNGLLKNRYLFANGIDQIEADEQVATGTTLWALTDHLGSVRDVVDNSGVNQNHIVYDAFGNITSQSNSSVIFRFGYTARELDKESGLQYNRARYLENGRFISEDPTGFGGGDLNLYRYVVNSPTILTDPSGLIPKLYPAHPECVILANRIKALEEKIERKYRELDQDKHGLDEDCPNSGGKPGGSRQGHRDTIVKLEEALKNLEDLYSKKCSGTNPAPKPSPVPAPENKPPELNPNLNPSEILKGFILFIPFFKSITQ
jgi:RHS repeat-associated protein